jgi:hypothetical protein
MQPEDLIQTAIALLGPSAIWLSQSRNQQSQRWACILGLISQPFWFFATWQSGQWGVFVVVVACAMAWLQGLWIHWIAPRRDHGVEPLTLLPKNRLK